MIYKILLIISWIYVIFGVIGIFRFNNMYARLLTGSKIDTAASITIIAALIIRAGISQFSIKLLLILLFLMVTNPISNHVLARSAYLNGIEVKKEGKG
ncbi:monovalent cation/H(+) antiporter subunit G [Thermohalobacter berrensis]|uniref:Cation:proton antiporter n=1 Tax=Thermohalobacter berrensis TaxID=99594 RepID=A0A419SZD9_9FIRM|nr:monovalent cation/H(+) antiporter subunit G [Thermohalobacter berrensis]RKD30576.1 cation:proton antiporter [Thermohalobacter berrensis]